ncbi:MAG: hypothetical protein ACJ756_09355, partial [Solirubrobacterales bacterium]
WFGQRKQYRDLGVFDAATGSLRAWVDAQTDHPGIDAGLRKSNRVLKAAVAAGKQTTRSASSKADTWRREIQGIKSASRRRQRR